MDKRELDKKINANVKPGTESLAINDMQTTANQLLTEQRMNTEAERQVSSSNSSRDTELRAALELGAEGAGVAQQPQQLPQQVQASAQNLRPETVDILSKYGVNPQVSESHRSSSNTTRSQSSNTTRQVTPSKTGDTRVTNTTNITNITNNTSRVETNVGNKGGGHVPTPPVQRIIAPAPVAAQTDNTGKFKAFLNNVFSKRNLEFRNQEKEFRKRDWSLKRATDKVLNKMSSISTTFARKMNPENVGRTFGSQLKMMLTMTGLVLLPKLWPSIIKGLDSITSVVTGTYDIIKESFSGEGTFMTKLGRTFKNLGHEISSSMAKAFTGDDKYEGGIVDALADKFAYYLGAKDGESLTEVLGRKFDQFTKDMGALLESKMKERFEAVSEVWDKLDWSLNPFSAKNIINLGHLIVAAIGGAKGAKYLNDKRMESEARDTFEGGNRVFDNKDTDNIKEGSDKKGNIVANTELKIVSKAAGNREYTTNASSTVNSYLNRSVAFAESGSDNNADKSVYGLQKVGKYYNDNANNAEVLLKSGVSMTRKQVEGIAAMYSINDEEKQYMINNFNKYYNDYIKNSLTDKEKEWFDKAEVLYTDGQRHYSKGEYNIPGRLMNEALIALTNNKFNPNRSYTDNQLILQVVREARLGNSKFDWSAVPRLILATAIPAALAMFGGPLGAVAGFAGLLDTYSDVKDGKFNFFTSNLSKSQQMSQGLADISKEYSEEQKNITPFKNLAEGHRFGEVSGDVKRKSGELWNKTTTKVEQGYNNVKGGVNTVLYGNSEGDPSKGYDKESTEFLSDGKGGTPRDAVYLAPATHSTPVVSYEGAALTSETPAPAPSVPLKPIVLDNADQMKSYRSLSERDRAKYIWDFLLKNGFNEIAASGIVGVIRAESRFDPMAKNPYSSARGICQWLNNRSRPLVDKYNATHGTDYKKITEIAIDGQLECMLDEMSKRKKFMELVNKASSPAEAADIMFRGFENGSEGGLASIDAMASAYKTDASLGHTGYATMLNDRIGFANGAYKEFTGNNPPSHSNLSSTLNSTDEGKLLLKKYNDGDDSDGESSNIFESSWKSTINALNNMFGGVGFKLKGEEDTKFSESIDPKDEEEDSSLQEQLNKVTEENKSKAIEAIKSTNIGKSQLPEATDATGTTSSDVTNPSYYSSNASSEVVEYKDSEEGSEASEESEPKQPSSITPIINKAGDANINNSGNTNITNVVINDPLNSFTETRSRSYRRD